MVTVVGDRCPGGWQHPPRAQRWAGTQRWAEAGGGCERSRGLSWMGRPVGGGVIQHAGKVAGVGQGRGSWDRWVLWLALDGRGEVSGSGDSEDTG